MLTFLLLLGWWVRDYTRENSHRADICGDVYMTQSQNCYSGPDPLPCTDKAFGEETRCYTRMRLQRSEILTTWALYAVGALLGAYLAALAVRTLGWTIQGFRA